MNNWKWIFKMAIKDAIQNKSRLLIYASSIVLGIASLVAIQSFKYSLNEKINSEAKGLLGADYVVSSRLELDSNQVALFDTLGTEKTYESSFASMLFYSEKQAFRLVNVKAVADKYPFYGEVETEPSGLMSQLLDGNNALVDKTIMLQLDLHPGDSINIGKKKYQVIGGIVKALGSNGIAAAVAPPVYIPLNTLEETGILQVGSRVTRKTFFKTDKQYSGEPYKALKKVLEDESISLTSVEDRKEDLKEFFKYLNNFLNLIGFISLILGSIGIASSVSIYLKSKNSIIATLRCIGAKSNTIFWIYFIEVAIIALITSIIGIGIGFLIQRVLPLLLQDFLVVDVEFMLAPDAVIIGLLVGVITTILFTISPLLASKNISPISAINASENVKPGRTVKWLSRLGITLFVIIFAYSQTGTVSGAIAFTVALGLVLLVLTGIAWLIAKLLKSKVKNQFSYTVKQGLSNIFRPNNQTQELTVVIGLGTMMISLLVFLQSNLISELNVAKEGDQPNMIMFDIQENQLEDYKGLMKSEGLPLIDVSPIIAMRLDSIKGLSRSEIKNDTLSEIPKHILNREYRVSYRDYLKEEEELIDGEFISDKSSVDFNPVYLEKRTASQMEVEVGDEVSFNVQGVVMKCKVSGIMKLTRNKVQTSFNIMFPSGMLEDAPKFYAIVTRSKDEISSAAFQNNSLSKYPNVSIVDLKSIISTVNDVIDKIKLVIEFLSLIALITGFLVLIGTVRNSKYQRLKDTVLLRTLGASAKQIGKITLTEYFVLGIIGSSVGVILGIILSNLLGVFVFEIDITIPFVPALLILLSTGTLVTIIGFLSNRSILKTKLIEVIRGS